MKNRRRDAPAHDPFPAMQQAAALSQLAITNPTHAEAIRIITDLCASAPGPTFAAIDNVFKSQARRRRRPGRGQLTIDGSVTP